MTELREQCVYICGPYQGYCGKAEWDPGGDQFHGEVIGVRDVITFQGRTPSQLRQAFIASVDDYLAFCIDRGEPAEKPFSGKFLMRVDPEVHRKLATLAELSGKSLNQYICDFLAPIAEASPVPTDLTSP